ncbi:glycerophosphoryl diester phosphodiesterase [Paraoerskovia marina]|uniref:Glycerophosphoryl diester phosphodiesterase n=1 Tax=Paraoerskovia marina TaxID=545619 RepID=A0A1H1W2K3_9CELL|nr:glycerophosphodiester phosphodiesterase family protein [Paraoerskovia marina]SDS91357.1 glycerophosphoryl diester phosphodiesterase [Paraoerskovia marina]
MQASLVPQIFAHRGNSSVAPQNTLASFEAAWRTGVHGIETDLRLTADGIPVVIHDRTVDRTTDGNGRVADLTLEQVRALDAGIGFSPAYAGQQVPTFDELVAFLLVRPDLDVLLELKGRWTASEVSPVLDAVADAGIAGRIVAQGFDPATVRAIATVAPTLRRGWLVEDPAVDVVATARDLDVWTCNPRHDLAAQDPGLVDRLHDLGCKVMVWTANTEESWRWALDAGVEGVVTDHPDRLRGWLAGVSARQAPSLL